MTSEEINEQLPSVSELVAAAQVIQRAALSFEAFADIARRLGEAMEMADRLDGFLVA